MKCKCKRCGYEWESRVNKPKTCPRCKGYFWDTDYIKKYEVTIGGRKVDVRID